MFRISSTSLLFIILFACTSRAQESYRGTYRIAVDAPTKVARHSGEESLWTFRTVGQDGRTVAEVVRAMPFDVPAPSPVVFENGRLLLLHSFDGIAELYDRSGDLVRRIPLLAEPTPDHERIIRAAVHDQLAVIGVSEEGSGVRILSIDTQGVLSERRRIEALGVTGVAVADDPERVAVGTTSWTNEKPTSATHFIDGDGIWSVQDGFTNGRFISDEQFLGVDDRGVYLVQMSTRTLSWSDDAPNGMLVVDAVEDGETISVLLADRPTWSEGGWIFTQPRLRTLDISGSLVRELTLDQKSFTVGSLETRGSKISVQLDGTIVHETP